MVFIDINEQTQSIFLPLPVADVAESSVAIEATSTADRTTVTFPIDSWTVEGFMLNAIIGLPEDLFVGEWEYLLTYVDGDGLDVAACGIMKVEETTSDGTIQYDKTIRYKQYGE